MVGKGTGERRSCFWHQPGQLWPEQPSTANDDKLWHAPIEAASYLQALESEPKWAELERM